MYAWLKQTHIKCNVYVMWKVFVDTQCECLKENTTKVLLPGSKLEAGLILILSK